VVGPQGGLRYVVVTIERTMRAWAVRPSSVRFRKCNQFAESSEFWRFFGAPRGT